MSVILLPNPVSRSAQLIFYFGRMLLSELDAVWSGRSLQSFQRSLSSSTLILDSQFLLNVSKFLSVCTASQPRNREKLRPQVSVRSVMYYALNTRISVLLNTFSSNRTTHTPSQYRLHSWHMWREMCICWQVRDLNRLTDCVVAWGDGEPPSSSLFIGISKKFPSRPSIKV
jgi:hypothetical protein